MSETFVKRVGVWGLLVKPKRKEGKWSFVQSGEHVFTNEIDAYKASLKLMSDSVGAYVYKPVLITVEVEIPRE